MKKFFTKWRILTVAIFVGICIGGGIYYNKHRANIEALASSSSLMSEKAVPVAVQKIEERTIKSVFSTHSFLQPKKEITLRPNANVKVREVKVVIGQQIKAEQILAYTNSEAQALRAELDQIDSKQKNLDHEVTMALAKQKFLSRNEYKQKVLEYKAYQVRQRLNDIETNGAIISPIDGIVSEINLKVGDFIDNPSQYSIKISDPSSYRIQLYIPQNVAAKLDKETPATLSRNWKKEMGEEVTESIDAKISAIAPTVDSKTGSVFIEITVSKIPKGWIAGMYVEVALVIDKTEEAVAVPNQALITENGQTYVYLVPAQRTPASAQAEDSGSRAAKTLIKTGLRDSKFTEVKEGLEADDLVVVEGQGGLTDGAKIQVVR